MQWFWPTPDHLCAFFVRTVMDTFVGRFVEAGMGGVKAARTFEVKILNLKKIPFLQGTNLNINLFLKLFEHPRDIPAKTPVYPSQNPRIFPVSRGICRTFWPPPLHVEGPHPTGRHLNPKSSSCAPFSSLILQRFPRRSPSGRSKVKSRLQSAA